jgi:hypothetical protein
MYIINFMIELKKPIELLSAPRNDGGDAVASASTVDGGAAFVRWDPKDRVWFIDEDLTAGDVLTLPPVSEKMFLDIKIDVEKAIIEGAKLADELELTKLKLRHEKYLKNKNKK